MVKLLENHSDLEQHIRLHSGFIAEFEKSCRLLSEVNFLRKFDFDSEKRFFATRLLERLVPLNPKPKPSSVAQKGYNGCKPAEVWPANTITVSKTKHPSHAKLFKQKTSEHSSQTSHNLGNANFGKPAQLNLQFQKQPVPQSSVIHNQMTKSPMHSATHKYKQPSKSLVRGHCLTANKALFKNDTQTNFELSVLKSEQFSINTEIRKSKLTIGDDSVSNFNVNGEFGINGGQIDDRWGRGPQPFVSPQLNYDFRTSNFEWREKRERPTGSQRDTSFVGRDFSTGNDDPRSKADSAQFHSKYPSDKRP